MRYLCILLALIMMAGCSMRKPIEDAAQKHESAKTYYEQAQRFAKNERYLEAIKYYELIETRYPFGEFSEKAKLEVIYAYYKTGNYDSAELAANRFIRLYPTHEKLDYAMYMRSLALFESSYHFISRYLPVDPAKRDLTGFKKAFSSFDDLIKRFPESKYTAESKQRMVYIRNLIAAREIDVAEFYLDRKSYVAAANRCKYVIEHFQGTPSVKKAYALQLQAYEALGLEELAAPLREVISEGESA